MSDSYFSENYGGGSGILYLAPGYIPASGLVNEAYRVGRTEGTVTVRYKCTLHRVEDEFGRAVDDLAQRCASSISGIILSREAAELFIQSDAERSLKVSAAYVVDGRVHYVYGSLCGDEVLLFGKDAHGYEFEVSSIDYRDGVLLNEGAT